MEDKSNHSPCDNPVNVLDCAGKSIDMSRTVIMGVLNVTPDSFSDGGKFNALDNAIRQAELFIEQGADVIDIGGESTRPNAQPVSLNEELSRVLPVIEKLASRIAKPISIDTYKPEVMTSAVNAGAGIINDVYALRTEGALEAAKNANVPVCLMHMQNNPTSMQNNPNYDNVVDEVANFLQARMKACEAIGISRDKIWLDPGFGFGKTLNHNVNLLNRFKELTALGVPILAGLSRKSMIGHLIGLDVEDREYASIALALIAVQNGANIVRVHDVKGTHDAIRIYEALMDNS